MKTLVVQLAHRPWPFVACLLVYLGFIGPALISATNTLAVLAGIGLLVLFAAWGYVLLRHYLRHKE